MYSEGQKDERLLSSLSAYSKPNDVELSALFIRLKEELGNEAVEDLVQFLHSRLVSVPPTSGDTTATGEETAVPTLDLKALPANEYLKRVLCPSLLPAMVLLEAMRPPDPIQFLAIHLLQKAEQERQRQSQTQ